VSTAPAGPLVVTTTAVVVLVGAGVTVPVTWMTAAPAYVFEFVATATVSPAANATVGPKTKATATRIAAMVLSVFISITW
jgi:radical SAM superfamily enzyme with C-terminal helix-hairpin-helix motif